MGGEGSEARLRRFASLPHQYLPYRCETTKCSGSEAARPRLRFPEHFLFHITAVHYLVKEGMVGGRSFAPGPPTILLELGHVTPR